MRDAALLALVLLVACGSPTPTDELSVDAPSDPDGAAVDAPPAVDADVDSWAPAPFYGQISVHDTTVFDMGGPGVDGRSLEVTAAFYDRAALGAPVVEDFPIPIKGCKVWVNERIAEIYALAGTDQATLSLFTGPDADVPLVGPCTWQPFAGYRCPDLPGDPADPLPDDAQLRAAKPPGDRVGGYPDDFRLLPSIGVGDQFRLGTAGGKVMPAGIPLDGTMFRIGCDDAAACGQSAVNVLDIITTDEPLAGHPPFTMPLGDRQVHVRCVDPGAADLGITVPALYAQWLTPAMSRATRIRVTFARVNMAGWSDQAGERNWSLMEGGHAVRAYLDVAP